MNAVDTNVLLYSVDRNEPAKQLKAQQLLSQLHSAAEPTVLLWQVWRDQGKFTPAEFAQHIQAFRQIFPLVLPTADAFDRAMSLAARFSLSHWDSMIVGACQSAGATRL
jgi:predicted nucleic acid-binding protein